jgi:hypothetical protein
MDQRYRTTWGDGVRLLLLGAAIVGGIPAAHGFRQDEVECDEALARLEECCPGFHASAIRCTYIEGCEHSTYPSILPGESRCIRDKSCDEIRQKHTCERIAGRGGSDSGGSDSYPQVCP